MFRKVYHSKKKSKNSANSERKFIRGISLRSNRQNIKSFCKFFVTASVKDFLVQISYTFKLIALIKSDISFIQMYVT